MSWTIGVCPMCSEMLIGIRYILPTRYRPGPTRARRIARAALFTVLLVTAASACGADSPADQRAKEQREAALAADRALTLRLIELRGIVIACGEREGTFRACDTRRELGSEALIGTPYGRAPGRVRVASAGADTFTVAGTTAATGELRIERRPNGIERRTCTRPGVGVCTAEGRW